MPSLSAIIFFAPLLVLALDLYVIALAVSRGHKVERTLAWIFAVIALPGLGSIAYLLLAAPGIKRTTRRKKTRTARVRALLKERAREAPACEFEAVRSILALSAAATGLVPTAGNRVELLSEDEQAFARMREAVMSAKRRIWAEYYLIRNDETGHRFLAVLAEKAREGVEVKLLYDAVGSLGFDQRLVAELVAAGGKCEAFLPVNPLRKRWSVHLRNHRKLIVVDDETGFTGGMNMGDEYSGRARKKGKQSFHDTHLMLQGPAACDLALIFAEDWLFATDEALPPPHHPHPGESGSLAAIVPSGPDQQVNANAMVYFSGIAAARERAWIVSPYFVPDEPTLQALISAALRGVDVRVIVPARSDVTLMRPAARAYYPELLAAGVRVFEYQPSMLHAKTMVVDGAWGIVGSANMDIRSFRLNFEVGAIVADSGFARLMETRFQKDLSSSREILLSAIAARPFAARLAYGAVKLLSPLL